MTPTELAERIAGGEKWAVDIHSCGYHCEIPACMKAQRLELLARLVAGHEREWVGLTKEEAADCWSIEAVKTWHAIETKLKEKNT